MCDSLVSCVWQAHSRGGSQQQVNTGSNALYASQPSQLYASAAGDTTNRSLYTSFPSGPLIGSGLALPPSVLGAQVPCSRAGFGLVCLSFDSLPASRLAVGIRTRLRSEDLYTR